MIKEFEFYLFSIKITTFLLGRCKKFKDLLDIKYKVSKLIYYILFECLWMKVFYLKMRNRWKEKQKENVFEWSPMIFSVSSNYNAIDEVTY